MNNDNQQQALPNMGQSNELSLVELIRVLAAYRYTVIGVAITCIVVATLAAFLATPIYRAEIQFSPVDDNNSSESLTTLLPGALRSANLGLFGGSSRRAEIAEGVATLKSPQFTIEFITENDLMPVLFAGRWDAETLDWAVDDPEDVPTLIDGYAFFNNEIRSVVEGDDGIITLAIEWRDPDISAGWANKLIAKLNLRLRTRAIDEANQTIEYLEEELKKTNVVEIQQAIYSMMENQIKIGTIANVREEFAFKVISPAIPTDADRFVKPRRALSRRHRRPEGSKRGRQMVFQGRRQGEGSRRSRRGSRPRGRRGTVREETRRARPSGARSEAADPPPAGCDGGRSEVPPYGSPRRAASGSRGGRSGAAPPA